MTPVLEDLSQVSDLNSLYPKLERLKFGPGWNKTSPSLWPEPRKVFQPTHWNYADAKAALHSAGRLISTELAERRNLILVNSCPGNTYATAATMVSAYQMIMPGEFARSHRHTPNALRLVVDAVAGLHTIVDDRKLEMLPGDVVLTPNWCWHGHGNDSGSEGYWIDFLDVPLVQALGPMFFDPNIPAGVAPPHNNSVLSFPWKETEQKLANTKPDSRGSWEAGVELKSDALRNFSLHMGQLLPNQRYATVRTSANCIYAVVAGHGATVIEEQVFEWRRGDVFVVPTWYAHQHEAFESSTLFKVTDEALMRQLGFLREEFTDNR